MTELWIVRITSELAQGEPRFVGFETEAEAWGFFRSTDEGCMEPERFVAEPRADPSRTVRVEPLLSRQPEFAAGHRRILAVRPHDRQLQGGTMSKQSTARRARDRWNGTKPGQRGENPAGTGRRQKRKRPPHSRATATVKRNARRRRTAKPKRGSFHYLNKAPSIKAGPKVSKILRRA